MYDSLGLARGPAREEDPDRIIELYRGVNRCGAGRGISELVPCHRTLVLGDRHDRFRQVGYDNSLFWGRSERGQELRNEGEEGTGRAGIDDRVGDKQQFGPDLLLGRVHTLELEPKAVMLWSVPCLWHVRKNGP